MDPKKLKDVKKYRVLYQLWQIAGKSVIGPKELKWVSLIHFKENTTIKWKSKGAFYNTLERLKLQGYVKKNRNVKDKEKRKGERGVFYRPSEPGLELLDKIYDIGRHWEE